MNHKRIDWGQNDLIVDLEFKGKKLDDNLWIVKGILSLVVTSHLGHVHQIEHNLSIYLSSEFYE